MTTHFSLTTPHQMSVDISPGCLQAESTSGTREGACHGGEMLVDTTPHAILWVDCLYRNLFRVCTDWHSVEETTLYCSYLQGLVIWVRSKHDTVIW